MRQSCCLIQTESFPNYIFCYFPAPGRTMNHTNQICAIICQDPPPQLLDYYPLTDRWRYQEISTILAAYWVSSVYSDLSSPYCSQFSIGFYFPLILNLIWNKEWGQTPHFNTTVTWLLFLTVVTKHFIVKEIQTLRTWQKYLAVVRATQFLISSINSFASRAAMSVWLWCVTTVTCAMQYPLLSEYCQAEPCINW